MMKSLMLALAFFATTTLTGFAHSSDLDAPGSTLPAAAQRGLTAKQRGNIARSLVQQWAQDVREQGGDVRGWALKLGRYVGTADADNVFQALDMPTYQTMMGVLHGQPVRSKSIQKALAQAADVGIESLGSTIADTTYTPLPNGRCRIADSRVNAEPLSGGVARALDVEETLNYIFQGGNGTFANGTGSDNCGIPNAVTAFAVSVTVLSNGNEGFFKIYENNKPFQTGSTVYYTSAVSASNDMIVTSCQTCPLEVAVYSSSSVNYVVDIVGYFMRNEATALECTTATVAVSIPAGQRSFATPICPAGYTPTGGGVGFSNNPVGVDMNASFQNGNGWFTLATNGSTETLNVTHSANCCRVPGR
jgi:hypothetical protein